MASKDFVALIIIFNTHDDVRFRMTLVSNSAYAQALQEAIGLGQRFMKNDDTVVRVEIYREESLSIHKPLVVLTREDLSLEENILQDKQPAHLSFVARCFHKIFGSHRHSKRMLSQSL